LHLIAKYFLRVGVFEFPHAEGIEPELGWRLGAEGDGFLARLLILVTLAVRPETDLVEVFEFLGRGSALKSLKEVVVNVDVIEDVLGIRGEAACICL
jgi:hypothetical protein